MKTNFMKASIYKFMIIFLTIFLSAFLGLSCTTKAYSEIDYISCFSQDRQTMYLLLALKIYLFHQLGQINSIYNADDFLKNLSKDGIEYIDMRDDILNKSMKYEDAFYKTDTHWKIETVFKSYTYLIDRLNADYNENLDSDYKFKTSFDVKMKSYDYELDLSGRFDKF